MAAPERLRWANLILLGSMPATATLVYWAQTIHGAFLPPEDLATLAMITGLLARLGCLIAGYRRARPRKTDAPRVAS